MEELKGGLNIWGNLTSEVSEAEKQKTTNITRSNIYICNDNPH